MIVIHHSRGACGLPRHFLAGVPLSTGVSFFFVLSGFILMYVHPQLESRTAVVRFIITRFARIWPAHFFTFVLVVLLGLHELSASMGVAITAANIAMVHAWAPAKAWFFSYNAVSWSISTEFFFYGAFPFLLVGFGRNWGWKLLFAVAMVVGLIAYCSAFHIPSPNDTSPLEINRAGLLYISPLARIAEFILGMVAQLFWSRWRVGRSLSLATGTFVEMVCLALCAGFILLLPDKQPLNNSYWGVASAYIRNAGAAPAFALIIIVFASNRGLFSRLFSTHILCFLGEISFSIYLLHQIFLRWIEEHTALADRWNSTGAIGYALFWLVLIGASWLVWLSIERPGRRLLLRLAPPPAA